MITGSYATINASPALIERCTFIGNSASNATSGVGGAVNLSGSSTVVTSTFENNTATRSGSALDSYGTLTIKHSTFRNHAGSVAMLTLSNPARTITLQNNLFAQNTATHFTGSYVSLGGNVSDKPDATTLNQPTDRVSATVSLSAAAANGGLVQTCELPNRCNKPAIDAGVVTALTADARGVAYVGAPDAGAYENGTGGTSSVTVANPTTQTATLGLSFAQSFSGTGGVSPYTFTLVSGTLPNGLTLSTAGSLSGTPTQTGQFTMIVQATDANGCVALSNTYSLTVGLGCQPVLHVTESGSGLQDGSSWANSLPGTALQTAIDRASLCGGGAIWVARGLYKPTSTTGFASRSVSFSMANNVQIYGGFAGLVTETTLGSRPTVNPTAGQPGNTTLSGDIGTVGVISDNSFHILYNPASLSLTNSAVLDGFVLANGNANFGGFNGLGAGMYNDGSGSVCSPTIRNCSFLTNNAPNDGGAGMYNAANGGISSPTLTNCLFMENSGLSGVAITNWAEMGGVSNPVLTNCQFSQNSATNGIFRNGAFNNGVCSPVIQNSTFERNAVSTGGCIYTSVETGGTSNPVIRNTVFIQNLNQGGQGIVTSEISFGGGTCHAVLTNCAFQSNWAEIGSTIVNLSGADSELINCSFQGNRGNIAGSVVETQAAITLVNCAFWDNGPYDQPFKGPVSAEYSLFQYTRLQPTVAPNRRPSISESP